MPPRLEDTEHALVMSRATRCAVAKCNQRATYDVSVPERWQDGTPSGKMSDWTPMCYRHAKTATEGKIR